MIFNYRRALLASTAIGTALALATPAQAGSDFYISVFGGANFLQDQSAASFSDPTHFTTITTNPDTGFVLGGAIGTHLDNWQRGLRAEVEVSYRRHDVAGHWSISSDGGTTGPIDGNASTFAIMANIWYDFDCGWKIKPYVGGGAGWARSKFDVALLTSSGTSAYSTMQGDHEGFAWQLGLGFNYEVAPDVNVGLGYRYFHGPNFDITSDGGEVSFEPGLDNDNHSVLVNLTIDIN